MNENLSHVVIQFFLPSYNPLTYLQKQKTKMQNPFAVECEVAIFLYYLTDEGCYRKTANAFGLYRNSVSILIRKVAKVIVEHLGLELIKLPKTVTGPRLMLNMLILCSSTGVFPSQFLVYLKFILPAHFPITQYQQ